MSEFNLAGVSGAVKDRQVLLDSNIRVHVDLIKSDYKEKLWQVGFASSHDKKPRCASILNALILKRVLD